MTRRASSAGIAVLLMGGLEDQPVPTSMSAEVLG